MEYEVDGWNNFCRIFLLPEQYPKGFCFDGGKPVIFELVDWFNPISTIEVNYPAISKEDWVKKGMVIKSKYIDIDKLEKELIPFLQSKKYIIKNRKYLILFDFGGCICFNS